MKIIPFVNQKGGGNGETGLPAQSASAAREARASKRVISPAPPHSATVESESRSWKGPTASGDETLSFESDEPRRRKILAAVREKQQQGMRGYRQIAHALNAENFMNHQAEQFTAGTVRVALRELRQQKEAEKLARMKAQIEKRHERWVERNGGWLAKDGMLDRVIPEAKKGLDGTRSGGFLAVKMMLDNCSRCKELTDHPCRNYWHLNLESVEEVGDWLDSWRLPKEAFVYVPLGENYTSAE